MIIRSSNLALRFYESDGWTKELLESMLTCGDLIEQEIGLSDEKYFILSVGSRFDIEKLLSVYTKLVRAFDDYPNESDKSFMLRHMW